MFDTPVNLKSNDDKIAAILANSWNADKINDSYDFERKLDFTTRPNSDSRRSYTPSKNYASVYTCGYTFGATDSSTLLYESNGTAIDKTLDAYRDRDVITPDGITEPMAVCVNSMYWAVAVYDTSNTDTGGLSDAFIACLELARDLTNYPVLDEDDLSRRESENEQEYLEDLARQANQHTEDESLVYTAGMIGTAIRENEINFGYGYYGEAYIKDEDLKRALFLAALDTYTDLPCSD